MKNIIPFLAFVSSLFLASHTLNGQTQFYNYADTLLNLGNAYKPIDGDKFTVKIISTTDSAILSFSCADSLGVYEFDTGMRSFFIMNTDTGWIETTNISMKTTSMAGEYKKTYTSYPQSHYYNSNISSCCFEITFTKPGTYRVVLEKCVSPEYISYPFDPLKLKYWYSEPIEIK